ncbi:DUF885 domain-containing protein [Granulicella sibirica]|uniref:DUF885 domain-containing protein n=1 Tax=Granulicella sibirica TaxID=2479048 RepID=A0A4V1L5Q3_9BACT|nr:DUF885 domain-containing protein [Granulicella sibirica]RXH56564.1 protein of unknown function DUF885 [Granulicella sibirica]
MITSGTSSIAARLARHTALALCAITLTGLAPAQPPAPAAAASPAARAAALDRIFSDYWQERMKHEPEFASTLGDKRYNDQLSDLSPAAVNASLQRGQVFIQRISEIDTAGLPEQTRLSAELLLRTLIDDQEGARFKEWEMPLDQFGGYHLQLPMLVAQLPFDTVKDYDDYITRLKKVPAQFSQLMTDLQLGVDEGRVPPKYIIEKVAVQIQSIAGQTAEASPFSGPLKKFPAAIGPEDRKRISADLLDAVSTSVLPSYQRLGKFVAAAYLPAGRKDPGVWALPDGDAYYAFRIRQSTTMQKNAEQIHQIGLDEVKRDETEMLAIAKKLGFADLKSFGAALKANPKEHPTSGEALLATYRAYLGAMQVKLPDLFGRLPKAPLEVVRVPEYAEKDQAPAYYEQGTPDGKRPGRININLYHATDRSLASVEAIAYHEGIPGHHLQISLAQEMTGVPEFRKQSYYTAYTEGWGLYSERLGKEIGFYQDPYSDYGRLEADIWRAIRLVVDTGVHSKHWTRQQMVDFFHDHSSIDETSVQSEVDRYVVMPGQALGYKMGQLKILEVRAKAEKALGPKFRIQDFHDVVLGDGALPMDTLEQVVDAWIARGGGPRNPAS